MKNLLRNVAYASIIVAAISVIMTQFSRPAGADFQPGGIVAGAHDSFVLLSNGEVWTYSLNNGWQHFSDLDLPVPMNQVKFWNTHFIITTNEDVWAQQGLGWRNIGLPDQPINVEPSTWSRVKTGNLGGH